MLPFADHEQLWLTYKSAAANRRPAGQSDGSDNLSTIFAADRAFPAAVAELESLDECHTTTRQRRRRPALR